MLPNKHTRHILPTSSDLSSDREWFLIGSSCQSNWNFPVCRSLPQSTLAFLTCLGSPQTKNHLFFEFRHCVLFRFEEVSPWWDNTHVNASRKTLEEHPANSIPMQYYCLFSKNGNLVLVKEDLLLFHRFYDRIAWNLSALRPSFEDVQYHSVILMLENLEWMRSLSFMRSRYLRILRQRKLTSKIFIPASTSRLVRTNNTFAYNMPRCLVR